MFNKAPQEGNSEKKLRITGLEVRVYSNISSPQLVLKPNKSLVIFTTFYIGAINILLSTSSLQRTVIDAYVVSNPLSPLFHLILTIKPITLNLQIRRLRVRYYKYFVQGLKAKSDCSNNQNPDLTPEPILFNSLFCFSLL